MRRLKSILLTTALASSLVPLSWAGTSAGRGSLQPFTVSSEGMDTLRTRWLDRAKSSNRQGGWVPLKMELQDEDLALMGLPSKSILLSGRYPQPTIVYPNGRKQRLPELSHTTGTLGPTVASFAGAGWFGIRPGALLLLLNGGSVGWCSMAHVYGSPGSYKVSTAGHCGKVGDTATVIALFGNRSSVLNPVLLDFGKFSKSQDGGLGNDWALIDVDPAFQHLVSPTMAFWGGPRGMYTKTGSTVSVSISPRKLIPTVSVNPDPMLAQTIVHYGHGTAIGTGGTPRAGEAIHWGTSHFMFFGAISPGDSGSGANTLTGDTLGANMEAAGIMTHLYIDLLMRQGVGIMGGTRATAVTATLADGQIVPYPVPAPGLP